MLTAGQQSAFNAEMRVLGRNSTSPVLIQSEYRPAEEPAIRVD